LSAVRRPCAALSPVARSDSAASWPECRDTVLAMSALTIYGAVAVTFMMLMYALERRGSAFVAAFACGCALASSYGFLAGTWPFGVVEAVWAIVALRRWLTLRNARPMAPTLRSSPAIAVSEATPNVPIACTLTASDAAERVRRWRALARRANPTMARHERGVEVRWPVDEADARELATLVAAERECCTFASWSTERDGSETVLRVTSVERSPDAVEAIAALFDALVTNRAVTS
jgi:hypothetical protein